MYNPSSSSLKRGDYRAGSHQTLAYKDKNPNSSGIDDQSYQAPLPDDVFHHIYSYIDNPDLGSPLRVNKVHRDIASRYLDPSVNSNYPIRIASAKGWKDTVSSLLDDRRVDPSDRNNEALYLAIMGDHVEVVRLLLRDQRVDPSVNENILIVVATSRNNLDIVKILLNDLRVDPNARNNLPLFNAVSVGNINMVDTILMDSRTNFDLSLPTPNSPIRRAISDGNLSIIRALVDYSPSGAAATITDFGLIINSIDAKNYVDIMEIILKHVPNKSTRIRDVGDTDNGHNFNNYDRIILLGNMEIIQTLLEKCIDQEEASTGFLRASAKAGREDLFYWLLDDLLVDPTWSQNVTISTSPLGNNVDIVRVLLEMDGVDPSAHNNGAIINAARVGNIDIVNLLLVNPKVDPSAQNGAALILSMDSEPYITKVLLEHPQVKAGINREDTLDEIAYFVATNNRVDMVDLLMNYPGIDHSRLGMKILAFSLNSDYMDVLQYMLGNIKMNSSQLGNLLDKAIDGNIESVKILLNDPRTDPSLNEDVLARIMSHDNLPEDIFEVVSMMMNDSRVDPSANDNEAIITAVSEGLSEVVALLLRDPRVDPSDRNNQAILTLDRDTFDILPLLLADPRVDPSVDDNQLIIDLASQSLTGVSLLMQDSRVDPSAQNNQAIVDAVESNNIEIIRKLLEDPRVNLLDQDNRSIKSALRLGYLDIVNLLLENVKVEDIVGDPELREEIMEINRKQGEKNRGRKVGNDAMDFEQRFNINFSDDEIRELDNKNVTQSIKSVVGRNRMEMLERYGLPKVSKVSKLSSSNDPHRSHLRGLNFSSFRK